MVLLLLYDLSFSFLKNLKNLSKFFQKGGHAAVTLDHKVLTYIEYITVSGVFRTIDPPPSLHPPSVSSPRTKGGGVHTRRAVRGWGGQ
jgi:hypothetical protein